MKKINNKGYMLIEIILAFALAFGMVFFLSKLTIKFKSKNDDMYYSTLVETDRTIVYNKIMTLASSNPNGFDCSLLAIDNKENMIKYNNLIVDMINSVAALETDDNWCENNKKSGIISVKISVRVGQIDNGKYDINFNYRYGTMKDFNIKYNIGGASITSGYNKNGSNMVIKDSREEISKLSISSTSNLLNPSLLTYNNFKIYSGSEWCTEANGQGVCFKWDDDWKRDAFCERLSGNYCNNNSDITLYANWVSSEKPLVSINVSNAHTFSYSSSGNQMKEYCVTKTNSYSSCSWNNNTSYTIDSSGTYYVFAKDIYDNISNSKSITAYRITRNQGTQTTLTTKYNNSSGTAFDGEGYALNGSYIYASAISTKAYTNISLTINSSSVSASGASSQVFGDTSITTAYIDQQISCSGGYYYNGASKNCTYCIAGYYCPAGTYYYFDYNQGITQCPSGTKSNAGASSSDNCYYPRTEVIGNSAIYLTYWYSPKSSGKSLSDIYIENNKWESTSSVARRYIPGFMPDYYFRVLVIEIPFAAYETADSIEMSFYGACNEWGYTGSTTCSHYTTHPLYYTLGTASTRDEAKSELYNNEGFNKYAATKTFYKYTGSYNLDVTSSANVFTFPNSYNGGTTGRNYYLYIYSLPENNFPIYAYGTGEKRWIFTKIKN